MLTEKYRPQHWRDLILPTAGRTALQLATLKKRIESGSKAPLIVWLEGPSGCGKSSASNVIANALGAPKGSVNRQEYNGSYFDHHTVKQFADSLCKWLFGWRVIIINEVQEATAKAGSALLDVLENLPDNYCVILTTMRQGKVLFDDQTDHALKTRNHRVTFGTQGIKDALAPRLLAMAQAEGLDYGADERRVRRMIEDCKNCIRDAVVQVQEGGLAQGGMVEESLAVLSA